MFRNQNENPFEHKTAISKKNQEQNVGNLQLFDIPPPNSNVVTEFNQLLPSRYKSTNPSNFVKSYPTDPFSAYRTVSTTQFPKLLTHGVEPKAINLRGQVTPIQHSAHAQPSSYNSFTKEFPQAAGWSSRSTKAGTTYPPTNYFIHGTFPTSPYKDKSYFYDLTSKQALAPYINNIGAEQLNAMLHNKEVLIDGTLPPPYITNMYRSQDVSENVIGKQNSLDLQGIFNNLNSQHEKMNKMGIKSLRSNNNITNELKQKFPRFNDQSSIEEVIDGLKDMRLVERAYSTAPHKPKEKKVGGVTNIEGGWPVLVDNIYSNPNLEPVENILNNPAVLSLLQRHGYQIPGTGNVTKGKGYTFTQDAPKNTSSVGGKGSYPSEEGKTEPRQLPTYFGGEPDYFTSPPVVNKSGTGNPTITNPYTSGSKRQYNVMENSTSDPIISYKYSNFSKEDQDIPSDTQYYDYQTPSPSYEDIDDFPSTQQDTGTGIKQPRSFSNIQQSHTDLPIDQSDKVSAEDLEQNKDYLPDESGSDEEEVHEPLMFTFKVRKPPAANIDVPSPKIISNIGAGKIEPKPINTLKRKTAVNDDDESLLKKTIQSEAVPKKSNTQQYPTPKTGNIPKTSKFEKTITNAPKRRSNPIHPRDTESEIPEETKKLANDLNRYSETEEKSIKRKIDELGMHDIQELLQTGMLLLHIRTALERRLEVFRRAQKTLPQNQKNK